MYLFFAKIKIVSLFDGTCTTIMSMCVDLCVLSQCILPVRLYYFQMLLHLHLLLVGLVNPEKFDVLSIGNAIVGQRTFRSDRRYGKQQGSVVIEGGTKLHVTYLPEHLFRDLGKAISEGKDTDIDLRDYHAVVVGMTSTFSDLILSQGTGVAETLNKFLGKTFIRKNCIVVVAGGQDFAKAQREGKIKGSFKDWCKSMLEWETEDATAVFSGVEERLLLFDTAGAQDVLNRQKVQLVEMVQGRLSAANRNIVMEKKFAQLKGQVINKTTEHMEEIRKNAQVNKHISDKIQDMEKLLAQLKEQVINKTTEHTAEIRKNAQVNKHTADRIQGMEKQFVQLKNQVINKTVEHMVELRKNAQVNKHTADRIQGMEKQFVQLKNQVINKTVEHMEELRKNAKVNKHTADRIQGIEKQFVQLKEQVINKTTEQMEENRKNAEGIKYLADRIYQMENQVADLKNKTLRQTQEERENTRKLIEDANRTHGIVLLLSLLLVMVLPRFLQVRRPVRRGK